VHVLVLIIWIRNISPFPHCSISGICFNIQRGTMKIEPLCSPKNTHAQATYINTYSLHKNYHKSYNEPTYSFSLCCWVNVFGFKKWPWCCVNNGWSYFSFSFFSHSVFATTNHILAQLWQLRTEDLASGAVITSKSTWAKPGSVPRKVLTMNILWVCWTYS